MRDGSSFVLHNVRYILELKRNWIWMGTLEKEGYIVKLQSGKVKVINGSRVVLSGTRRDNYVYSLDGHAVGCDFNVSVEEKDSLAQVWHKRLGNISEAGLQVLEKQGLFGKKSLGKLEFCENYVLGKSHLVSFSVGRHTIQGVIDYVHSDLWGPSQVESSGGKRYFLSINDDYSRRFEQLCIESGIAKHLTVVGMPQQNGSPLTAIEKKTPMDMWSRHLSNYGMVRIFGYVVYSHVKQGKLELRAVKCVLLGYPEGVKGYRLYRLDDESPKIFTSRNVVFNESVMYKDTLKDTGAGIDKFVEELQVEVELQRYKARLVALGFTQRAGIDYNEVFSPVVRHTSIRVILALTAYNEYDLEQLDVKTTFLLGNLEKVIYMRHPPGYEQGNKVCLLKKYLYGLKQSPSQWYKRFDEYMLSNGFKHSSYDSCIYYRSYAPSEYIYLLSYVDNMMIACKSKAELGLPSLLKKEFDMKELGEAKKILGMEIVRDRANAVRSLIYLMVCMRPDIAYAVSIVSRYLAKPGKNHWEAVKWILKYLWGTANVGLVYGTNHGNHVDVTGFVDSNYAKDPDKEAEYMALTEAVKEAIWLRGLLEELGIELNTVAQLNKTVKVLNVGTEHNAVDALTNVVPGLKLQHCLELLNVVVMSSASSAVTYTSIYTDSEPGRAFWGADDEEVSEGGIPRVIVLGYDGLPIQPVAPPLPDYIPGLEDPQTPPVPQDEDEPEEQPLPPVDSPTAESPGYVTESDLKEDPEEYEDDETEDGPVNYPIDGGDDGDDDNGDSSRDDANDEDDDEDEEDEEEEHLALADFAVVVPTDEPVSPPERTNLVIPPPSTDITIGAWISVRPQTSISLPPEAEVERLVWCMAPPAHSSPPLVPSPLLPSSGCPTQIQTLRIASTQALINAVTVALPSPPLPPLLPSLYIPPLVDRSRYEIGESSTATPTRGRGIDYGFISTVDAEERRQGIRDVGYGIRDTWVDPAEAVPEIAPMTIEEVNTRVTELAELHEHDTHDLYALLEDAQDRDNMDGGGGGLCFLRGLGSLDRIESGLPIRSFRPTVHETRFQMQQDETAALRETDHKRQAQMVETLCVMRDMRREMGDMQTELLALRGQRRARQPAPDARVLDHQDASGDADSHV
ncbi:retrovirus-related pol polyprotein from transposon TNT 1-94 [Tanacetum coccineum]